jgi:drug/metabolite transporter superfamily protein YnfA
MWRAAMRNPMIQVGILALAAALEVGGDAVIRTGLRGNTMAVILLGFATLGSYGVVNLLPFDFSKLLGTYVAFFALASVAFGRLVFRHPLPLSAWIGLAVVMIGSGIIQWGPSAARP